MSEDKQLDVLTVGVVQEAIQYSRKEAASILQISEGLVGKALEEQLAELDSLMDATIEQVKLLPENELTEDQLFDRMGRVFAVVAYVTQLPVDFNRIIIDDIAMQAIRTLMIAQAARQSEAAEREETAARTPARGETTAIVHLDEAPYVMGVDPAAEATEEDVAVGDSTVH